MSKHKKHHKLHHVISTVVVAAFAFTTVLSQVGSINGDTLKATIPDTTPDYLKSFSASIQSLYSNGTTTSWFVDDTLDAVSVGIIEGDVDKNGQRQLNPTALTNWAQALTMMSRVVAGGKTNIPDEVDRSIYVVQIMPDWAQSSVYYLIKNGHLDSAKLEMLLGDNKPSDNITRIEMIELAGNILKLELLTPAGPYEYGQISRFVDIDSITAEQRSYLISLVMNGVINGESINKMNPDGDLNRASFIKILMQARRAAIQRGSLDQELSKPVTGPTMEEDFPEGSSEEIDITVPTI